MKKKIILLMVMIFTTILLSANQTPPEIEWDKTFGGSGDDVANSIIQTTDGGYAVAGDTYSKGAGDADFWVVKLDKNGNRMWDKTFGGSSLDVAKSIIQTKDDGFAVVGYTYSKGAGRPDFSDFWVIKLNKKGKKIWDKTFGGSGEDRAHSIIQTTDGGFAVTGFTESQGARSYDFWVIKLNKKGKKIWDKKFAGKGRDKAYSIIQTTDGGFAVTGETPSKGAGWVAFWVIRLDENGNRIWDKTFGETFDVAYSIIQTTDSGFAVAGKTMLGVGSSDFWVVRLDKNGNKIWDKTFGGSSLDRAYSIIQTKDGGFAVAGTTKSKGAGDADFWVVKLDENGNRIWDKTFGGWDPDWAYSIIQTKDGGFAVAGTTKSKGAGCYDLWVIKLKGE